MKKTPYYSYLHGKLPKGCQYCVKGEKLVLFITGLCPRSCYYCPISDKKYKKDVTYADEWKVKNIKEIIKEAELINAKGAGFTGGDPLCKLLNTLFILRTLKKKFGKDFHVHLYTSLHLITKKNLKSLHKVNLDEIRFHLDLENDKLWNKIKLALNFDWDVGVEIPVVPKKEKNLKKIILFLDKINQENNNRIKFLNLNELEVADNKVNKLLEQDFKTKNELSYALKGSEELALKLMKFVEKSKLNLNVHYCTAKLKDKVQLANRIKRRAKNIALPTDKITKEGMLKRGVIYLEELKPSFSYMNIIEKLPSKKRKQILLKLNKIKKELKIKDLTVDEYKLRMLTSQKLVRKNKTKIKRLNLIPALVEEYPTHDSMEIEIEIL